MQVFSGLEQIRRRPEMYFPGGVTPSSICSCLLDDCLSLGATRLRLDCIDGWYVVSADVDWLRLPENRAIPLERLFGGMYPHPTRINGVRAEAFVGAFAEAAYAATPEETRLVVGNLILPDTVSTSLCPAQCVCSVAFLLGSG
jgi:hypothetical protein